MSIESGFGDRDIESEEEILQRQKEAQELEQVFLRKSLGEKLVAEYQTKKPTKEHLENRKSAGGAERGESTRFERGQIFKAYRILRKEIKDAEKRGENTTSKKELLKEIRSRAKQMERNLDELEKQMQENVEVVEVETEDGKFSIPVTVLDLRKKSEYEQDPVGKESEKDDRVPYVFWGGIRSNAQMNGCAAMSMALAGQKIYVPMHLEQEQVKKPENLAEILSKNGNFEPHARITKELIKQLGLEKSFNLMGYSAGAGIALEAAIDISKDSEFEGSLNDLIVIEPLGLDEKGLVGLAKDFGVDALTKVMTSPEAGIKVLRQGGETNKAENTDEGKKLAWETVKILAEKQFTAEQLSKIEVGGNFQWWVGRSSTVTNLPLTEKVMRDIAKLKQADNPDATIPELNEVVGGTHSLLNMNALGIAREFVDDRQDNQTSDPRIIKRKDLANSAMAEILENI